MADTVLDISTVVAETFVRIDGTKYRLKTADHLPIVTLTRLERLGPRVGGLLERAGQAVEATGSAETGLSGPEELELTEGLVAIATAVLDAPAAVHARLTDLHRIQIATAFAMLQSQRTAAAPGAKGLSRRIGSSLPRASSGSTGARTRRHG